MATTADIRNGLCIEFNDDIFQIIELKEGNFSFYMRMKWVTIS